MIDICGVQIDFDITSPTDLVRYKQAGERMEAEGEKFDYPEIAPSDPGFIDAFIEFINNMLQLYGNFIDDAFGEGYAERLLGDNPSLNRINDINDAIVDAMAAAGEAYGTKVSDQIKKYAPNRATRRAQK